MGCLDGVGEPVQRGFVESVAEQLEPNGEAVDGATGNRQRRMARLVGPAGVDRERSKSFEASFGSGVSVVLYGDLRDGWHG